MNIRRERLIGLTLAPVLALGATACASTAEQRAKSVAAADEAADSELKDQLSTYNGQYRPYVLKLGLDCVKALTDASTQDSADTSNSFSKETAAALIKTSCPSELDDHDRAALYRSFRQGVGIPLAELLKTNFLDDGLFTPQEQGQYQTMLEASSEAYYIKNNIG